MLKISSIIVFDRLAHVTAYVLNLDSPIPDFKENLYCITRCHCRDIIRDGDLFYAKLYSGRTVIINANTIVGEVSYVED